MRLCRGKHLAHGLSAAFPAWPGANRQAHAGADHPGVSGPRPRQQFQLPEEKSFLEMAKAASLSGVRAFRQTAAGDYDRRRSPPGHPEAVGRFRRPPGWKMPARPPQFPPHGLPASPPQLHYRSEQQNETGASLRGSPRRRQADYQQTSAFAGRRHDGRLVDSA